MRETALSWDRIYQLIQADFARQGAAEAKELWEKYRFALYCGTNGFGDEFAVLAAPVTWEEYVDLHARRDEFSDAVRSLARIVHHASDEHIRFVSFEFDPASENFPRVEIPVVLDTGEAVRTVLRDMESAIREGRPLSGVDRAHTALQGHLEYVCTQAGISFRPDSQIPFLFRELLRNHPAFSRLGAHSSHVQGAVKGLSRVVESLGPARNRGSVAHPNEDLLDAPEATLFVHAAATLLTYLEQRLAVAKQP